MCEGCFQDRRAHAAPGEGDYLEPMTRESVARANSRLRMAARAWEQDDVEAAIRGQAVKRHRARKSERGDFGSVGDYLAQFQRD